MSKSTLCLLTLALALVSGFAHLAPAQSLPEKGESCSGGLCAKGLWCEPLPGRCGSAPAGTCASVPQACTMEYRPVCGCDGHTHSNDCVRRNAKAGLRHQGACKSERLKAN